MKTTSLTAILLALLAVAPLVLVSGCGQLFADKVLSVGERELTVAKGPEESPKTHEVAPDAEVTLDGELAELESPATENRPAAEQDAEAPRSGQAKPAPDKEDQGTLPSQADRCGTDAHVGSKGLSREGIWRFTPGALCGALCIGVCVGRARCKRHRRTCHACEQTLEHDTRDLGYECGVSGSVLFPRLRRRGLSHGCRSYIASAPKKQ